VRFVEIRGAAEAVPGPAGSAGDGADGALIRIHPRRVISFGLDRPNMAPHLATASRRTVA
jgi:pyridoxamine 5'-phosphate oxidase family protein